MATGYTLFDTAIGRCGIAWSEHGVRGVEFPQASDAATRRKLLERNPEAREDKAPPAIEQAMSAIGALLRGEPTDLSAIALDLEGVPAFDREVYELARRIPCGATATYGELTAQLRQQGLAKDVGQALGRNRFPIIVPCHRVLAAGGKAGGFSARGGLRTKLKLLMIEGAIPQDLFSS